MFFIFSGGFSFSVFNIFFFLFLIVFVLVFGLVLFTLIRGMLQWKKNNRAPRLTVDALVTAKRTQVSSHRSRHGGPSSSTSYYATFQVESGDRMELSLSASDFALIAEGDRGRLSFQGTRFLGFERKTDP